jgi:hypothetical protein
MPDAAGQEVGRSMGEGALRVLEHDGICPSVQTKKKIF